MLKYILLALMMMAIAGAAVVRVRPIEAAKYHVEDIDPLLVAGRDGQFSLGEGGDIPAVQTELDMSLLGSALADLLDDTPRTSVLAGSLTDGEGDSRIATYVTRTQVFGFPDVTTVQIDRVEGGSKISMHGRQVYGVKDFGVNEARLRAWIAPFQN